MHDPNLEQVCILHSNCTAPAIGPGNVMHDLSLVAPCQLGEAGYNQP